MAIFQTAMVRIFPRFDFALGNHKQRDIFWMNGPDALPESYSCNDDKGPLPNHMRNTFHQTIFFPYPSNDQVGLMQVNNTKSA